MASVYDWQEDARWLQKCEDKLDALRLKKQLSEEQDCLRQAGFRKSRAASKLKDFQQAALEHHYSHDEESSRCICWFFFFIVVSIPLSLNGLCNFRIPPTQVEKVCIAVLVLLVGLPFVLKFSIDNRNRTYQLSHTAHESANRAEDELRKAQWSEESHLHGIRCAKEGIENLRHRYAHDRNIRRVLDEPWREERDLDLV